MGVAVFDYACLQPVTFSPLEGRWGGGWRHPTEQERKMMKKLGFDTCNSKLYAKSYSFP